MYSFVIQRMFVAGCCGVVLLGGAAWAEVNLQIQLETEAFYSAGTTTTVRLEIVRADVNSDPDSDVTAMGVALTLPDAWTLVRDAGNACAPALLETQNDEPVDPANHPVVFVKGANVTYLDPPSNTNCAPLPGSGNVLELNWVPGGGDVPLSLDFPVAIKLVLFVPADAPEAELCQPVEIETLLRYRVLDGGEQTDTGGSSVDADCVVDPVSDGDLNGDNSVDPADAQLCFEVFLQIPEALDAIVNPGIGDFCGPGDGFDPADAQGIFNTYLQLPNPCL